MKKTALIFALFIGIFASCKKKDDNGGPSIVGSWKPVNYIEKNIVNGGAPTYDTSISTPGELITFTSQGTVYEHYMSDGQWQDDTMTYSKNGNSLTMADINATILTLNSNSLVFKYNDTSSWGGNTQYTETTVTLGK